MASSQSVGNGANVSALIDDAIRKFASAVWRDTTAENLGLLDQMLLNSNTGLTRESMNYTLPEWRSLELNSAFNDAQLNAVENNGPRLLKQIIAFATSIRKILKDMNRLWTLMDAYQTEPSSNLMALISSIDSGLEQTVKNITDQKQITLGPNYSVTISDQVRNALKRTHVVPLLTKAIQGIRDRLAMIKQIVVDPEKNVFDLGSRQTGLTSSCPQNMLPVFSDGQGISVEYEDAFVKLDGDHEGPNNRRVLRQGIKVSGCQPAMRFIPSGVDMTPSAPHTAWNVNGSPTDMDALAIAQRSLNFSHDTPSSSALYANPQYDTMLGDSDDDVAFHARSKQNKNHKHTGRGVKQHRHNGSSAAQRRIAMTRALQQLIQRAVMNDRVQQSNLPVVSRVPGPVQSISPIPMPIPAARSISNVEFESVLDVDSAFHPSQVTPGSGRHAGGPPPTPPMPGPPTPPPGSPPPRGSPPTPQPSSELDSDDNDDDATPPTSPRPPTPPPYPAAAAAAAASAAASGGSGAPLLPPPPPPVAPGRTGAPPPPPPPPPVAPGRTGAPPPPPSALPQGSGQPPSPLNPEHGALLTSIQAPPQLRKTGTDLSSLGNRAMEDARAAVRAQGASAGVGASVGAGAGADAGADGSLSGAIAASGERRRLRASIEEREREVESQTALKTKADADARVLEEANKFDESVLLRETEAKLDAMIAQNRRIIADLNQQLQALQPSRSAPPVPTRGKPPQPQPQPIPPKKKKDEKKGSDATSVEPTSDSSALPPPVGQPQSVPPPIGVPPGLPPGPPPGLPGLPGPIANAVFAAIRDPQRPKLKAVERDTEAELKKTMSKLEARSKEHQDQNEKDKARTRAAALKADNSLLDLLQKVVNQIALNDIEILKLSNIDRGMVRPEESEEEVSDHWE